MGMWKKQIMNRGRARRNMSQHVEQRLAKQYTRHAPPAPAPANVIYLDVYRRGRQL